MSLTMKQVVLISFCLQYITPGAIVSVYQGGKRAGIENQEI